MPRWRAEGVSSTIISGGPTRRNSKLRHYRSIDTGPGEVHNVKNASATAPGKALAFYVAKVGTPIEGLSVPVKPKK